MLQATQLRILLIPTLRICNALTLPVCLTWGPLHRSINGPHLKYTFINTLKHGLKDLDIKS